ncbi:MAG: DNA-binding protein [Herbinix sp.]|jgi:transcriptional regulator with XRE-family HTH domain|nr:DNA-binding protein [Herbinix sp.]
MNSTQATAGELIKKARKQAKLTQKQLATKYGIPTRSLEDWETNRHSCPNYVVTLLLHCLEIDFPTETVTKPAEPVYTFTDKYGKPLPQKLADLFRAEFLSGKVQEQPECSQDFYGETILTAGKRGKLYLCTDPKPNIDLNPEQEIPMGFEFRVIKEV